MIDADVSLMQAPTSAKNRGVDDFVDAAAVSIVRPVRKQPDHMVLHRTFRIRGVIMALQEISGVFSLSDQLFDFGRRFREPEPHPRRASESSGHARA